jgi:tetratricopeptide (TPR) repeat protein
MSRPPQPYPSPRQQSPAPRQGQSNGVQSIQTIVSDALEHHRQGRLPQAEQLYLQILAIDPHHADTLHLLGVLAHQVGRDDVAVELIRSAIAIDKRQASYHSNLGASLQAQGKLDEAASSYEQALELNPEMAEAQMNLGAVLEAQGKHDLAEARFRRALALRPGLAEIHVNLGNILQAQGKLEEAVESHERALALKPDFAEACFNRGNVLQAQGKLDDAVASYERALTLKPGMPEFHGNLGNALQAQDKLEEAVACYRQALALKPDYAEAWYNLGNARQAQHKPGKLEEAMACYECALQLNAQLPEAHYNLGNTLHALDRLDEAAASYERALTARPRYAEAHYNLGCVLEELGRLPEALASIARALEIKPEYSQARFGQALAQLRGGDFSAGWRSYEARWQSPDHDTPWRAYPQPAWNGEKLAAGRLLLWGEQGIGDEIMFAGLIPDAVRAGNRIVLDCDPRLKPLFARSFPPSVEVVSGCGPAEAREAGIAAQLPTGSLPGLFRRTEAAFAATASPFLQADPAEREQFRARYGDGRRLIGLAWHTKNQKTGPRRSIALEAFAPLFALSGIRWISLQYGDFDELEAQAASAHAPLLVDRTVDQFADMDRFAAQVAAMDQVLTIDNSTAHLAGALGVPVGLLLPFAADWRWLQDREDSPWYRTMRHFRQPRPGDWQSVLDAVCGTLVHHPLPQR